MLKEPRTVRHVAQEISDAADGAIKDYRTGDSEYETDLTGRIVGAICDRLRSKKIGGIGWRARSLRTGRGKGAEESKYGADLLGVLDIDIPGYRAKKGFLAQSKRIEPGSPLDKGPWSDLVEQCEKMLARTPDSFVLIYSKQRGIRVFPANAVIGLSSKDIFELYDRSLASFFESHITCFIGDGRLNSTDIESLNALSELPVQHVLELKARSEG